MDTKEIAAIQAALERVDFDSLPRQIKRGPKTGKVFDARAIKIMHDGHTVREQPHWRPGDRRTPPSEPPGILPFVLAPVDDLVAKQIEEHVAPELERRRS